MKREIVGTFKRFTFTSDDGDFVIARVVVEDANLPREIGVKGNANPVDFAVGSDYLFYGTLNHDSRYGYTLAFNSYVEAIPTSKKAFINFIAKHGKGCHVGPATAQRIFDQWGDKCFEVICQQPDLVAETIGISSDDAAELAKRFSEVRQTSTTMMAINELLDGRGFPKSLPKRLIDDHGVNAIDIIKNKTYQLLSYGGVGFKTCDSLYLEMGGDQCSVERQMYCGFYHGVMEDRTGSTWRNADVFAKAIHDYVPGNINLRAAIELGQEREVLAFYEGDDGRWIADYRDAKIEYELAQMIVEAQKEKVEWPDIDSPIFGSAKPSQKEQLRIAFDHDMPIACMTGLPGTGKTFTTAPIIKWAVEKLGGQVLVLTPTGKAAVRSKQVFHKAGIDVDPKTAHSALIWRGGSNFVMNERNPLEAKFILIDEVSMFDNMLLHAVMLARPPGCMVLLVGDPQNQLPPVGRGCPALDLTNANAIPTGYLTKIYRNQGLIVDACHKIANGRDFKTTETISEHQNLKHINVNPANAVESVCKLVSSAKGHYDPIWDVQVICPINEKSKVCRKVINEALQKSLNPDGRRVKKNPFRVNDKVICRKNSRFQLASGSGRAYVANGDMGVVTDLGEKWLEIQFRSPDRKVKVYRESGMTPNCDIHLGYAITCHSSQGSSFKVVVVVLDDSYGARNICDRSWIYTAISRAEEVCFTIGKKAVARKMIGRVGVHKRKTFLIETMKGEFPWSPLTSKPEPVAQPSTPGSPSFPTIENHEPAGDLMPSIDRAGESEYV